MQFFEIIDVVDSKFTPEMLTLFNDLICDVVVLCDITDVKPKQ